MRHADTAKMIFFTLIAALLIGGYMVWVTLNQNLTPTDEQWAAYQSALEEKRIPLPQDVGLGLSITARQEMIDEIANSAN